MPKPGPLTGQKLGAKYLLGDVLGQGGFGAVYLALHVLLQRQQAVKVLFPQGGDTDKFIERFLREGQTLAAMDHPNIVHVDDVGADSGVVYLVMPFIGGGSLSHILRARGALPPEQVLGYLDQIAAALDYAHARGVVHLDLKPLNFLVHEDGHLLLSDFGLAHIVEEGQIEGSASLQSGTPTYMAPEHINGKPEQRSDIYSLGVMLFEMLSGRFPFEGPSATAIMVKHLQEPPQSLRAVKPDAPVALEKVINKALAKRPAERYATAGDLLRDFEKVVDPKGARRRGAPVPAGANKSERAPAPEPEPAVLAPPKNKYHQFRRDTLFATASGVGHAELFLLGGVGTLVGIFTQAWPLALATVVALFGVGYFLGFRKALAPVPLGVIAVVSAALACTFTLMLVPFNYDQVQISHFWFGSIRLLTLRHQIIAGACIGAVCSLFGLYVFGASRKESFLSQLYVGVVICIIGGAILWLVIILLGSIFDWGFGFGYGLLFNLLAGFVATAIAGMGVISLAYVWKKAFSIDIS